MEQWDQVNRVIINPSRKSYRETFLEELDDQLATHQIENTLNEMMISATHQQLEAIDELIKRILNTATRKIEGMKRNTPHSKEKQNRRAVLSC